MKRVIIAGASSGIGYALASAFASRRVKVGVAARNTDRLAELKKRWPAYVEWVKMDVTDPAATDRLEELIEKIGGMDIYVHCAGIGCDNPRLDPEREAEIVQTNAVGFARMLSAAYRWMRGHGVPGRIAAITSVAGTKGIGRLSAYSASKAFGQRYMAALEQLAYGDDSGVSFIDIRPGWVDTPLLKAGVRYPMEMSVEYVVPHIIKAIVRRKRVAVIDLRWNLLVGAWRMLPNTIWTKIPAELLAPALPGM